MSRAPYWKPVLFAIKNDLVENFAFGGLTFAWSCLQLRPAAASPGSSLDCKVSGPTSDLQVSKSKTVLRAMVAPASASLG